MNKETKEITVPQFIGKAKYFNPHDHIWYTTSNNDNEILCDVREVCGMSETFQSELNQFITDAINEKLERSRLPTTKTQRLRQIEMVTDKAKILLVEKPKDAKCIESDASKGFIKFAGVDYWREPIQLPHNNYKILGMVCEAVNATYADKICKEIVDCYGLAVGYRNYNKPAYLEYLAKTPVDSFKSLLNAHLHRYNISPTEVYDWEILLDKTK